jgi:hypothetical protein
MLPGTCAAAIAIAKDFHLGSIRNGALVQDGPVRVRWHAPEMIP